MNRFPIRQSLSVLLPSSCLVCDRPLKNGFLCFRCIPSLPNFSHILHSRCASCFEPIAPTSTNEQATCATCLTLPLASDAQRFVWEYRGLARDFIKAMKYRPSKKLARFASIILRDLLPVMFPLSEWDVVVPIPSSAKTFRKRSFHPCVELGHHVAQALNIPLRLALASDSRRNPQAKLHHDARLRGINKLFTISSPHKIRGKRVLLIEDVITTGATANAAALCLKAAGARGVDIFALSRAQAWRRFRHRVFEVGKAHKDERAAPVGRGLCRLSAP